MLELKDIVKNYDMQDETVQALKGINVQFRETEFVSILGQSGCGKTTLLNIVGGLDKYTSGDLIINGVSTKEYKDKDWDKYRNHKVGFIFQSYNLIPHLTVLENVELALTLSGIGKFERRKMAKEALEKVGLSNKLKNKPNQLSGGQMQRVAIARAIVNNPDIILADEPTGALDSKTSVQIMDILKEISNEKLIIMVTHNPQLAEEYSSRIIKLLDGYIVDDSNPYDNKKELEQQKDKVEEEKVAEINEEQSNKTEITEANEEPTKKENRKSKRKEKTKMSFLTALSLSFKNLLTKKARTFLVSFAGSIGIIGIALILSLSNGFQAYVDSVQKNTLSSYPVQLTNSSYNLSSLMEIFMDTNSAETEAKSGDKIYTKNELTDMLRKFNASSTSNDLKSFKTYINTKEIQDELNKYASAIQYVYNVNVNAYYSSAENGLISANETTVFSDLITQYGKDHMMELYSDEDKKTRYGLLSYMFGSNSSYYSNKFWSEMINNQELLKEQYEIVTGSWSTDYNKIMVVVDKNNQISDYTLYGLGLLRQSDLNTLMSNYINSEDCEPITTTFELSDIMNLEYKIILDCDYFVEQSDHTYVDIRDYKDVTSLLYNPSKYVTELQRLYDEKGTTIKVAGIIKEKEDSSIASLDTNIVYNASLTKYIIEAIQDNALVSAQLHNDTINLLTNTPFAVDENKNSVLNSLGYTTLDDVIGINMFPINFEAKENIVEIINNYNDKMKGKGEDGKVITYSDTIGTMMSSITTIISAVSYVLIAFVSISLIVSSIMIGIITYISVLERIKEIGVLRSIGASKKNIKHVFVSESVIIGFVSGVLGILITLLLNIPINIIIESLAGLSGVASLPIVGGIVLVIISILLTFIAGLIPARIASKKDPVIALRTE